MKKKSFIALLILTIILCMNVFASARDIKVLIDGKPLSTDVAPQLVNGRTMLPMRAIFEKLGARVTWMENDNLVFASKGDKLIVLKIDSEVMSVQTASSDQPQIVTLDVKPYILNGRTMIPVRAVAEALEADVDWIDETSTVTITTK